MKDTRPDLEPTPRRWAWRIGSLAGVSIYLHATFLLLLAWIAVSHISAGHGLVVAGQGLLLIACVFAVVVLHEMGHALVARRFGIATRDITLYPIGDQLVGLLDPAHIDQLVAMRGMRPGGLA